MANTRLEIIIDAKDRASATLKSVGGTAEKMGGILKATSAAMAVAFATGGAAAIAFGKSSVDSFMESQKMAAQLGAVLKSTAGVAGITKDAALSLASALEKQTTFSDEAVLSAENMLLTFTNIGKNVFPEATKTVLDMSVALGQDTKSSAIQLGKALQDPIDGVTALRRVGVNFTEAQQKQIETMVKSGKVMDAQKFILKELSTEFGGSAAAQAETFQGKMIQLSNAFDNFKETIGEVLVGYLTPFLEKLTEITAQLPTMLENARGAFGEMRTSIANVFSDTNMYWVFVKDIFLPLWISVRETVIASWKDIRESIKPIQPELEMLAKFFGTIIVGSIIVLVRTIAEIIKIVATVSAGIVQMFSGAIQTVRSLFGSLFSFILGDNKNAIQSLKEAWTGFKDFLSGLWRSITGVFASAVSPIIDTINKIIAGYNKVASKVGKSTISEIRFRATGGPVMAGRPYMVGERGPEMFIPSTSGRIDNAPVSNSRTEMVFNFNFSGAFIGNKEQFMREIQQTINRKSELLAMGASSI